jgi:hypothetical protein
LRFELTAEGDLQVFTELKNDGDALRITNQPPVTLTIKDAHGVPVQQIGLPVDFMGPLQQTAIIPTGGVLSLRVDEASVAGNAGKAIVQIGGQGWELAVGSYWVSGTMNITQGDGWHGTLSFPATEVVVRVPNTAEK